MEDIDTEAEGITWGEIRNMSDAELRETLQTEISAGEPATFEDMHLVLMERERNRTMKQIRNLVVVIALCFVVIALSVCSLALEVLGILNGSPFRNF